MRHRLTQLFRDQRAEAGGRQPQLLHRVEGALAGRVKFPQFVEFVSKELQSHWEFTADGKHVHDVATSAPGAFLVNAGHPFVAELAEAVGQIFEINAVSLSQGAAAFG